MPTYQITSPSGQKLRITGDAPPTEQDLDQIFSKVGTSAPSKPAQPKDTSILGGIFSFAKNADDAFLGGLAKGGANLVKLVNPQAGQKASDFLDKKVIRPDTNPTPAGKAGQAFGGAEKNIVEGVGSLAAPEVKAAQGATAAEKALALLGKYGVNATTGGVIAGADTGSRGDAASAALLSGLLSGGTDVISAAKNATRKNIGKTAVGQVFGNPSKDTTSGIFGKNAATNENSDYNRYLDQAEKDAPKGIPGVPIAQRVETLLGGDPSSSSLPIKRGFGITGAGPAGLFSVHPEDKKIMQDVVDFANGGSLNTSKLQNLVSQAKELATAYGLDVTLPKATTTTQRLRASSGITDQATAQALAKSFKTVLENGGHLPLNFTNSAFANIPGKQATINTLWEDIGKTAVEPGANSVRNLDQLKQRIDQEYTTNPTTKADKTMNAVLESMRNTISESLSEASPSYKKAMEAAQGSIAGNKLSVQSGAKRLGNKVLGSSAGVLALLHPESIPGIAGAAAAETLAGPIVRGVGSSNRFLGKLGPVAASQTAKNAPGGMAAALKALGIIP